MSTAALLTCDPSARQYAVPTPRLWVGAWLRPLCAVPADVAVLFLSSLLIGALVHGPLPPVSFPALLPQIFVPLLLLCGSGLYSLHIVHPAVELRKVTSAMALSAIVLAISGPNMPSVKAALLAVLGFSLRTLFLITARTLLRAIMIRTGLGLMPTIIIGSEHLAQHVFRILEKHRHLGLKAIAVLDDRGADPRMSRRQTLASQLDAAVQLAGRANVSEVIIADAGLQDGDWEALTSCYESCFKRIVFVSSFSSLGVASMRATDLSGLLGLAVDRPPLRYAPQLSKRLLDVCVAGLAALFLLPLFALLYVLVRFTSTGPAVYGQRRIGRKGEYFQAWKFRSMVFDADAVLEQHLSTDARLRQEWEQTHKLRNDPRILPVGHFVRKTSLDELPKLWNVLRGEMSMVGPRPIVDAEVSKYGRSFEYYKAVRPGLTGMWQISGRSQTSYAERVRYDEYFVKNWSIWLDLYILFRTVKTVLLREGAC